MIEKIKKIFKKNKSKNEIVIFAFIFSVFYAQLPFLKIGIVLPSFRIPSIFISAEPTIKSTCV
jgi:hypothetical protein